jgi:hypothetical protein
MIYFAIACVGLTLFLGARYLAQSVRRTEPRLSRIEPLIPTICFAAMVLGLRADRVRDRPNGTDALSRLEPTGAAHCLY